VRIVERVPFEVQKRSLRKATDKWRRGQYLFRESVALRTWTTLSIFHNKVHDFPWFIDLLDSEEEPAREFRKHYEEVVTKVEDVPDIELMAAMNWSNLKTLSHSDTPNWFRLSEGLTHQLMVTELRDVQAVDVQLPHPGFYIELPPKLLYWDNRLTGRHEARVVAVAEGCPTRSAMSKRQPSWISEKVYGRRLLIVVYCEPNENSKHSGDDNVAYFTLPLQVDEATVEDLYEIDRRSWADKSLEWVRQEGATKGSFGGREMTLRELRELTRSFVVNVLLYLSSDGAEVEHIHAKRIKKLHGKKRKSQKKQIADLQDDRTYLVGSTIRVNPDIKKYIDSQRRGAKFELKHRTLVRGHWRNQAHGAKRLLRKRIWIKPFVKKKDLSERVLGHNYEVG
jgi:hypothetical protein